MACRMHLYDVGLHQTDSMRCAVRDLKRDTSESFTERYQALMRHYRIESRYT